MENYLALAAAITTSAFEQFRVAVKRKIEGKEFMPISYSDEKYADVVTDKDGNERTVFKNIQVPVDEVIEDTYSFVKTNMFLSVAEYNQIRADGTELLDNIVKAYSKKYSTDNSVNYTTMKYVKSETSARI